MLTFARTLSDRSLQLLHKLTWIGPLLVRVAVGLVFVTTGWGKLHDLDTVTEFFRSLGIPAAGFQAVLVSSIELVGGLMLIAGLGTRIASMLLVGVMAVALWTAKRGELHGVVELAGTIEVAYLVMFVWLAVYGAGAASLDHLIRKRLASAPSLAPSPGV